MTQDIVSNYWGDKYFDPAFNRTEWQAHPASLERLSRIQGGMMREDWFANKYLAEKPNRSSNAGKAVKPVARAIGIGVGRAETEIALLAKQYVEHFDLFDVSPIGLEHAKATADSLGFGDRVTCHCTDVEEVDLPPDSYDLATFIASLHHMTGLNKTLSTVRSALKPGGLLWAANEYVGPNRFGYPENDLKIVRALHSSLPERFRKHGDPVLQLPTPEEVAAADPSEAPFSSEIIPTLKRLFSEVEITDLYGSFAFMLFWGLNHDALYETPEGAELVELILAMDQGLVECGTLPGYFAHLVARKTAATRGQSAGHFKVGVSSAIRWVAQALAMGDVTPKRRSWVGGDRGSGRFSSFLLLGSGGDAPAKPPNALWGAIADCLPLITRRECANYFEAAGYESKPNGERSWG